VWRLILEGVVTLSELETHWSLDDLIHANEAMDVRNAVTEAVEAHRRKNA
jgi:hypothetical protein